METIMAVLVGVLYAGGLYLVLRRSIVKLLIGLAILSHAANLLIFTAGGLPRAAPPLVADGDSPGTSSAARAIADPLPQALILTAIVISFAVLAFSLVLMQRAYQAVGTDDLDRLNTTDR